MGGKSLSTTYKNKEVVIQSNAISRGIYTCSPLARKLISYCILKVEHYPQNTGNPEIETLHHFKSSFPISEFIGKLGISRGANTYRQVRRAVEELSTSVIQVENTEESFKAFPWFSSASYDKQNDLIELDFNQQIGFAILEWKVKEQFSAMNIKIIGELQSFYALRYFELACSYYNMKGRYGNEKGKWTFKLSVEEIKTMFKIDKDAYKDRMNNFIMKVVKNPIEELNKVNHEFSISYSKIVENHKTAGFEFTCAETDGLLKIEATDSSKMKEEKTEINEEIQEIEYYKTKYSKEFEQAMIETKAQQEFPFEFNVIKESRAVEKLKKQGLK